MAEAQTQIEEDDIDETAQKAAEIGKQIGVVDNKAAKEDDAPDYEVIEGDDADDARIAKQRDDAYGDSSRGKREQLSNKEKRELRKKRLAEKFNEKDAIIGHLQSELQATNGRLNEFENRFLNIDKSKVEDAIINTRATLAKATSDYETAFSEGDGKKATAAMDLMYQAKQGLEKLEGWKQQNSTTRTSANAPDPRTISKAKAWADKHKDWYNPNGADEDSEIAKSLSGVLANEGYDSNTERFWKELDKRLVKRGIIDADEAGDDEDDEPAPKKRKRASGGSPPVSGGSNRDDTGSGKIKISLPTHYVNTLKENGIWDDVPRRNRVIQGYLKARREAQA